MSDRTIDIHGREWRILPVVRSENHVCAHCYHFAPDAERGGRVGECRLIAPRADTLQNWPTVLATEFCAQGAFRAVPYKPAEGAGKAKVTPLVN